MQGAETSILDTVDWLAAWALSQAVLDSARLPQVKCRLRQ
jgi:hypothetical protein